MNSQSDSEIPPLAEHGTADRNGESPLPANWKEALLSLVSSRIALIQLESKEAAGHAAQRAAALIAAILCLFFTWALLLAGTIAIVSTSTGWQWGWVAIGAAAIHLLVAMIFASVAKSHGTSAFPVTRSEFQKDREWIENLQKTRKSNV